MKTFGRRLKRAREAKAWSRKEAASHIAKDALGRITWLNAFTHWEEDEGRPSLRQLKDLCEALGVSADHLLGIPEPTPTRDELKAALQRIIDAEARRTPGDQGYQADTIRAIAAARTLLGE
jgi:transcriptional regulator with XRE-family HTH domain